MQIAKKITLGGINDTKKGFKGITEITFVGRIVGIARSVEHGETQVGVYNRFKGEFQATNKDGEIIASPVCFLVPPADSLLADALKAAEGAPVNFGFDFHAIPDADAVLGYKYRVSPLFESKPSDPMAALLAQVSAPPVLTLAKPEAKVETAAAAEPVAQAESKPAETAPPPVDAKAQASAKKK